VVSLESELVQPLEGKPSLKLAINRDSLDLYFLDVLSDKEISSIIRLEIIADDQDHTLNYLKSGQADMCISSQSKPLPNHTVTHLGDMVYRLVCAPEFYNKYFKSGSVEESLVNAPVVIFDKNDKVHFSFLKEKFNIDSPLKINQIPSVPSFKKAIIGGFGYGLIPTIDIENELKKKQLIEIIPAKKFKVPLYLHQWEYQKDYIKVFNRKLLKAAARLT
jgi:LysR family transcriptional regulator (chromosome initiation inhibitor)